MGVIRTFVFTMKRIFLQLITVLVVASACGPLSPVTVHPADIARPDGIIFATFSAKKIAGQSCQVELVEYRSVKGQIKENPAGVLIYPVDVILEDSARNQVSRFLIEHPLVEDFEYADDQGRLQRMVRARDSAQIFIRFNRLPSAKFIRFVSENPALPIIHTTIKLQP